MKFIYYSAIQIYEFICIFTSKIGSSINENLFLRFLRISFLQNPDESNVSEARVNDGFFGSELSLFGSKASLDPTKQDPQQVELQPSPQEDPQTVEPQKSPQEGLQPETIEPVDKREDTPQQSEDLFSLFSSQLFDDYNDDASKYSPRASPVPTTEAAPGGDTLTAVAAGSSTTQEAEQSTSAEDSNASSREKTFWEKARQRVSQRRRSGLEHNRVLSTEGGKITICMSCL